jgi:hypothetical protein
MARHNIHQGPSAGELRMKAELDRARREIVKLKKGVAPAPAGGAPAPPGPARGEAARATAGPPADPDALSRQVAELTATRQRLSQLYFSQVEENRRRGQRLHLVLESIGQMSADLKLDSLLHRVAENVSTGLGFRVVHIRTREPGAGHLRARAFVGIDEAGRAALVEADVAVEDFQSWQREEFRVNRSYFISHRHEVDRLRAASYRPSLGPREEWEWHEDDVLLVPLLNRAGELLGYVSVNDPVDRLVPSTETIELLEILGTHAAVAIENARLYGTLEEQARQLRDAGQRAEELHALKSNFVATISHELRTPLTALRAFLDTLLSISDGEIPADRLRHILGIMNEETQRLGRLIESVLDLNRFDSGTSPVERRSVDIAGIVEGILEVLGPVAEAGQVSLKLANECADTQIQADPDQMRQLVLHLASNGVKFTPPGGEVTVLLSGSADEIVLRVEDTGIGIPEEALERVFERFYQVDSSMVRRYGGAGLGLAVCKSIVEWHGGRITAESVPGRGSCFTVALPRCRGARVALRSDPSAPRAAEDLLRLAIEMVAEVMGARVVSLLAPEPSGELLVRAAIGLDERVLQETRIPPGTGVAGWVAQNRRPLCVANAQESSEIAGSGRERYRTRTFISVPLEGAEGLLGVLNVTDPVSCLPFAPQDCELLLQLADRVGAAWAALSRPAGSPADEESTARTVRRMLCHFERSRGDAPGRVRLARALAEGLELSDADVATVSIAAGLHDIGMGQLPGSLRESAGAFSTEERDLMQRHVEIGVELLERLEALSAVREIVQSHHEWWDGTGYPRGLSGEAIPVGARILATVDAWESMTLGRPHRPARTEEEARIELGSLAGRQFDPRVIEAFERVLDAAGPALRAGTPPAAPEGLQATDDANAIARR